MSDPDNQPPNNNLLSFLTGVFGALNHPYVVNNYAPILTNLSIFFNVLFSAGIAVAVNHSIQSSKPKPLGEGDVPFSAPTSAEIVRYKQEKINMKLACSTPPMKAWARKELGISDNQQPDVSIDISDSENSRNIWPVFRWRCFYRSGNETTKPVGLDLKEYCQNNLGEDYSFGYKDYLDPNSFYCTRIDNDANLRETCDCENDLNSTRQNKAIYSNRRLFEK